mgnify:CR=1 FL=1
MDTDLRVDRNLHVSHNTTIGNRLRVERHTHIKGHLSVQENGLFRKDVEIDRHLTVGGLVHFTNTLFFYLFVLNLKFHLLFLLLYYEVV